MTTQIYGAAQLDRPRHRFILDDYHAMAEVGILGEDDRVELIGGEVVQMAAMGARRAGRVQRLTRLLLPVLSDGVQLRVQLPVAIPDYDEPEPDLALVRAREDDYDQSHPTPADVLLLIEVADTSLVYDRGVKFPIYARAGIPETWIADPSGTSVERHGDPDTETGAYRSVAWFGLGETVRSSVLAELTLPVDSVLGRASSGSSS
ncbi:MAG: Uma2 family endonuclease [Chloroflexota bacterium]|nr:Uma2 family endonuclease [Chloroflexota bacterium]